MKNIENIGDSTNKRYWLYVLKLEDGKYYIGVTAQTPEKRFEQHKKGFAGAAWTSEHKPIKIFDRKDLGLITYAEAQKYENKVVRKYIKKYGHNNVRGGDLRLVDPVVKRLGWFIPEERWVALTTVILLTLIIIFLGLDRYL
ncbi:hypothetical protein BH23PAT2_BH23PAT2_10550 [soil metagenome]